MHILVCPDKFKGSLSAAEAAEAIRLGISRAVPEAICRVAPIADGGEGTAEALIKARGGEWIEAPAHDPLGRSIVAHYGWIDGEAVIDLSAASGLSLLSDNERDPLRASTFGTGELISDALRRGAHRILLGLGGSATNDAGAGMAAALGFEFLTSDGDDIEPIPANFLAMIRVIPPENLVLPEVIALSDVTNPLLGPRGATRIFGPQKGATGMTLETLEAGLEHLADMVAEELGCDFRTVPGAGAAGGAGFGALSFLGAKIQPGFETIALALGLERAICESQLVITGEGRIDAQTLDGKGPAGVAALAHRHGRRVIAFCGRADHATGAEDALFDEIIPITPPGMEPARAFHDAASLLAAAVERRFSPAS
jgi:glycerate kinase